jgi:hypothetical protein
MQARLEAKIAGFGCMFAVDYLRAGASGTDGSRTLPWREMDSNFQSR